MKRSFLILFIVSFVINAVTSCKDDVSEKNINSARIVFFLGDVQVKGSSGWSTPSQNMEIKRGNEIKTGKTGQCNILIGANSYVSVKGNTHLVVDKLFKNDAGVEQSSLELKIGKSVISPKKLLKGDSFEVKTNTAVAAVRGTKFLVESKPKGKMKIAVVTGKVEVSRRIPVLEKVEKEIIKKSDVLTELKTKVEEEKIIVGENQSAFIDNAQAESENRKIEAVITEHVEEIRLEIKTEIGDQEEIEKEPERKNEIEKKIIKKNDVKIEKALASLTIMEKKRQEVKEFEVRKGVDKKDIQAVEKLDKEIEKSQQEEVVKKKVIEQTELTIKSPINGSRIYVNGRFFGKGSIILNPKEDVVLKIQVRAKGYENFNKEIKLDKGEKKTVTAAFVEAAQLIIKTPVKNSRIYINSKYYGKHEIVAAPGSGKKLAVLVIAPGYKKVTKQVTLEPGKTRELNIDLIRSRALDRVRWSSKVGKNISVEPVYYKGMLIVATADGNVLAMNRSGKRFWKANLKRSIEATPLVHKGKIFIVTSSGKFYALKAINGTILWKKDLTGSLLFGSKPVIYKKNIYLGTSYGKVYALDMNGNIIWQKDVENGIYASPVVSNGLLFVGTEDHNIYAFNISDGSEKWQYNTDGRVVSSSPVIKDNILYVGTYAGTMYALKSENGKMIWKFRTGNSILSTPLIYNNKILFGSNDKYLYTLDMKTGKIIWKYQTNSKIVTRPSLSGSTVYITSGQTIHAVALSNGALQWKHAFKNRIKTTASVSGSDIFLGLENGDVASVRQNVLKSYE